MTLQQNNPLHGITLRDIVEDLEEAAGWECLAKKIPVRCFMFDPTVNSSLKFLRKTPWAREKVEKIWIELVWSAMGE